MRKSVSKDDVIVAIRECARKLGRPPSAAEFAKLSGITRGRMWRHFQRMGDAIRAAGLEITPNGTCTEPRALLTDWARVARKAQRLPTRDDYRRYGEHSARILLKRFGHWKIVPVHFVQFARENDLQDQWQDVLGLIARTLRLAETEQGVLPDLVPPETGSVRATHGEESLLQGATHAFAFAPSHALFPGRPLAGGPLSLPELCQEPANEAGVLFVFGMMAHRLGFRVISLQSAFPDCEAMYQRQPGKWQRVRVEFEFESRNFKQHGHDPDLCDVIVCWRHNWPECPPQLEVVELRRAVVST